MSSKNSTEIPESVLTRIRELREEIHHHDRLYYLKDQPEVSDSVYDQLFKELQDLEERFPNLVNPDSPTQRVAGVPLDKFEKVQHEYPMLSLDSHVKKEDVQAFDQRVRRELDVEMVEYTVEPKYDGLSVELVYDSGNFIRGSTRGDGRIGENITMNLRTIRALPLQLLNVSAVPSQLVIRSEVYIPLKDFHALNQRLTEEGEEPFANPRNAAAGSLRQLDSRLTASRPLTITCYDLKLQQGDRPSSHWDAVSKIGEWGLPIPEHRQRCRSIDEVMAFHVDMESQRDQLPFEIDGIVVKVDRYDWQQALGEKSRSPRWAMAFKFPPRKEMTKVHRIMVSVGRTGALTPIAMLNPVEIGGVTVSRASLHNIDEVARKDIRPGDTVKVERAGDVIPDVVERIDIPGEVRAEPFTPPTACPVCQSHTIQEGPILYCTGQTVCPAQLKGALELFASKGALNIDGLGKKTVAQLVDQGFVKDLADFYTLTKDQLLSLEGFAEKSATQLLAGIEKSKQVLLSRFIFGLGIRNVGVHIAQVLARHFGSLARLSKAEKEKLQQIHEIGPEIAASVDSFFQEPQNLSVLQRMEELGVTVEELDTVKISTDQPLAGKIFVLTGTLEGFTRLEAKQKVESLGGRVTSSVSKQTDYVVAGTEPGSKLDKAQALGLTVLDEAGFSALLVENVSSAS
ncbi:NAD-dependent DNA ligase LigA [Candidatus Nitrospira salsa]